MPKRPILIIILAAFAAFFSVRAASTDTAPKTFTPAAAAFSSSQIASRVAPASSSTAPSLAGAIQAGEPDIPTIVDRLDFGVPAGNGYSPQRLAVDGQKQRLYSLNRGLVDVDAGNTISVVDLDTGQVTDLIELNNATPENDFPPEPLDLQVDPFRPRLYALSGDSLDDSPPKTLFIIDTDRLAVIDTLPGVEALASGPDRLYLANDSRLWAVDPLSLAELEARPLEPRQFNHPLRLDVEANRLYLGRGRPAAVELFAAGTLAPISSYPLTDQLLELRVDPGGQGLLVIENNTGQALLHRLDSDGRPLSESPSTLLAGDLFSRLPLALAGEKLYLVDQNPDNFDWRLQALTLPDLDLLDSLPLANLPNDLVGDPSSGLLYAAYSSPTSYILVIEPATGRTEMIFTAVGLIDALADPEADHLYVLDGAGALHRLSLTGYEPLDQIKTGLDLASFDNWLLAQLALDSGRHRLYLSGNPVRTIDLNTLRVTAYPGTRGQLTPDPTTDRLYLTPPCQCRAEPCNTLILSAETLTGAETLFPPEEARVAPCPVATRLDAENQLLYAHLSNGTPGSNAGFFYTVFDTRPPDPPRPIQTMPAISYGNAVLDPAQRRAFIPRQRHAQSFIHRFEAQNRTITQTLELVGASGQLAYNPQQERLYTVSGADLQLFDDDLALLAEIRLPGRFDLLAFDPQGQRLYLGGEEGQLLVVATGGGTLQAPPPLDPPPDPPNLPALDAAPDGTRFHLDQGRLLRSRDDGRSWQRVGRGLPARPLGVLAISPDFEADQTLLAGVGGQAGRGGLYRSVDGGDTWRPATRGLTDLLIEQIVFSPTFTREQTVFLTTQNRGLFRSTDAGQSWQSLADTYATELDHRVSNLAVSPAFAADGYLILGHDRLLRSTDGGQSWQSTGLPPARTAFSPNFSRDSLILSGGRWRSTDGGQNWQPAAAGLEPNRFGARRILFSPNFSADQTVYLLLEPDFEPPLSLQRSVDGGRRWQSLLSGLPSDFELATAALLPDGQLYLGATDGQLLAVSPDSLKWGRPALDINQLEPHDLAIGPDGAIFIANSSAGVFKSTDGGRTWSELDYPARADISQPVRLALAGDGTLFAAAGPVIERSTDGGQSWSYLADLPPDFTVASLAVSPNFAADETVLAGGDFNRNDLIRSTDGGQNWTTVFEGSIAQRELNLIAFSPNFATDRTVYAWLQGSGLLRSTDGGQNWSLAGSPDEQSQYFGQSLAVSPEGDRLYLGALDGHLLASSDGGRSWRDLAGNIPDDRVWSSALALPGDETIFLGTDVGLYRSRDGGRRWTRINAGLPLNPDTGMPPAIRALAFEEERLYAALAEGGLYLSDDQGQSWRTPITGQPDPAEGASPTPPASPPATPPTPAAPVNCFAPPTYYGDLWQERVAQLGCASTARTVTMVEQPFENGRMFWRGDLAVIYVLPSGSTYARFDDTWDESQPAYTCPDLAPMQTPPTPQRGFGKVWCTEPQVRQSLGLATGPERRFETNLQTFETGLIFQTDQEATYILESQTHQWERVE